MRMATICMNSGDDKSANVKKAEALVRIAAGNGARWVVLPELFPFMGDYKCQFDLAEEWGPRGALVDHLGALAQELKITLFAGSFAEKPAGSSASTPGAQGGIAKVYNTMLVIGPDGNPIATYRKTHLFSLNTTSGEKIITEANGFLAGDARVSLEHEGLRVGLAICYDLRFSALFMKLAAAGALDLLCVPSAFTKQTGRDHWHLLLRSRAIEQQCYVVAANQTGVHAPNKESYGHALVVDPWGEVVDDTGADEGIAYGTIERSKIAAVRARLPLLAQGRKELY